MSIGEMSKSTRSPLDAMAAAGFIRPDDLKLFSYVDSPEEAYDRIVEGAGEGWNPPKNGSVQT